MEYYTRLRHSSLGEIFNLTAWLFKLLLLSIYVVLVMCIVHGTAHRSAGGPGGLVVNFKQIR